MNCPNCQAVNDPDARFCKSCGYTLEPKPAPSVESTRRSLSPKIIIISGVALVFVGFIIVGIAVYWLISQSDSNLPTIGLEGGTLTLADGAQLTLPPDGISGPVRLQTNLIPIAEFEAENIEQPELATAAAQTPSHLSLQGAVYQFELVEGSPPENALLTLPIPTTTAPSQADLYGWDGSDWRWLPARIDSGSGRMTTQLETLPKLIALMQAETHTPVISTDLSAGASLPDPGQAILTELLLPGFFIQPDGNIEVDSQLQTSSNVGSSPTLVPSIRNWRANGQLPSDAGLVLSNPTLRQDHLEAVVALALDGDYPAVQIDYRGLDPARRDIFTSFVQDLAAALHEYDKSLWIRVEAPVQVSATRWETGTYDWVALGQTADRLQTPLLIHPAASIQSQTEALLPWVIGQVERTKLQPVLSRRSLEVSDESLVIYPSTQILTQLGPIQSTAEDEDVEPDTLLNLSLAGLSTGSLQVDSASGMLRFEGTDTNGAIRRFYLSTNANLSLWLQQLSKYNLAGVVLEDLLDESPNEQTWEILQAYRASAVAPVDNDPVWVWTVTQSDAANEAISREIHSLPETTYNWTAPETPGDYQVVAALSADGGNTIAPIDNLMLQIVPPPTPTPTPPPRPTPTPIPTLPPTSTPPPPPPTATPLPPPDCSHPDARITSPPNGATIRGVVPFIGSANLAALQYYKIEYKPADQYQWQYLTQKDGIRVVDASLFEWHTNTVDPGTYDLRLIVVEASGNYPTPCEMQVIVQR